MSLSQKINALRHWFQTPAVSRAIRATAAFMTPIVVAQIFWPHRALEASFAALCAHNTSLLEMRGPYKQRFLILLFTSLVLTFAAGLGVLTEMNVFAATAGVALLAALGFCWRHFSPDYGPNLSSGSFFVFLVALSTPVTGAEVQRDFFSYVVAAIAGAGIGTLYQVILWPVRPQQPLRQTIADGWEQFALFCEAMIARDIAPCDSGKPQTLAEAESLLSEILNKNVVALDSEGAKRAEFLKKLDAVNLGLVRLTARVTAFHSTFEPILKSNCAARLAPAAESLYTALANLGRSIATTVVMRDESHFGLTWLRFQRVQKLARVLRKRLSSETGIDAEARAQAALMAQHIETLLPALSDDLKKTIESAGGDRLLLRLPNIGLLSLKPLRAGLNFTWPPDPALVRYAVRVGALMMVAVALFKSWNIPYGHWIAITMIVVLQPSYGPTRERAWQRILGTTAGGIAGGIFAWFHPSHQIVDLLLAAAAFFFALNLKDRYAVASFFVTLLVVLSTEVLTKVGPDVPQARILCTIAGGLPALVAAIAIWPHWEKNRFPKILAKTLSANRDYLLLLASRLVAGNGADEGIAQAKRLAESAGSELFASLQRLSGDPKSYRGNVETSASLMSSTLRITRALTALSMHLNAGNPWNEPALDKSVKELARFIEAIARIENAGFRDFSDKDVVAALRELDEKTKVPDAPPHAGFVHTQLEKVLTEIETMGVALRK